MSFLASSIQTVNPMTLPILFAGACVCTASLLSLKKKEARSNDDNTVRLSLPDWANEELPTYLAKTYRTDDEMMSLAIHLSAMNVENNTGGPFGAAIFERLSDNTSILISVGVNRVVSLGNSTLHGETVAIQMAQAKLKSFTLQIPVKCYEADSSSKQKIRQFELFTSCEPCCMCLGATLWSGVSRLVCGAAKSDAEAIGFDEGPVFAESYEHLKKAGIDVTKLVLQKEAAKVLENYGKNGLIYN